MTSNVNGSVTTSIVASLTALVGGVIAFRYHTHTIRVISEKLTEQRQAERTGRIRAEVRLRSAVKEAEEKKLAAARAFYQSNKSSNENDDAKDQKKPMKSGGQDMLLRCVGTVVSPFTKRMGTPRQGALAPHARGFIQFDTSVAPMETVSGLELYSHAWVIFCFHANTDTQSKSVKTKVRPPRAGGLKVGQMATRSPHRPNPIGLSLVKIVGIDHKKKRLYISAFDLVHGTPVFGKKINEERFIFLLCN
jgi:tRNA-Thr(GGU) m(6)t(6)A37 methyltransferase TsaA